MFITSPSINKGETRVYIFKKEFNANKDGKAEITVTASGKYKLFIDNTLVFCGPQFTPEGQIYIDKVSLTEYLKNGNNEIVIEIAGNENVYLYVNGFFEDNSGTVELSSNSTWLVSQKNEVSFEGVNASFARECINEFNERNWQKAKKLELSPELSNRTISPIHLRMRCVNILENNRDIYDAAELTSGFVKLKYSGKGKIKLIYFDSFKEKDEQGNLFKNDREKVTDIFDTEFFDEITVDDEGEWESFYPRTFRYIKVEIAGDASCDYIYYIENIYPLGASVLVDYSNDIYNKLWQLSVRTLQCSAKENYLTCPYSKPILDIKSAYLQMIYTYQVSKDILLAKNTIYTLLKNLSETKVFESSALYFVLMVYEYYIRFGDDELLNDTSLLVNNILSFFKDTNFEDIADAFMYIYSLEKGAYINRALDIKEDVFLDIADKRKAEIKINTEDLDLKQSVWAVLSECVCEDLKKDVMINVLNHGENIPLDFSYYVLRALEKADLYFMREKVIENFKPLIENNCTTIPESLNIGGECFGESAVLLYDFTAKDLGVTWEKNKFRNEIEIRPCVLFSKEAKGKVVTAFGDVFVEWKKGSNFSIELYMPPEVKKVIYMPDNTVIETYDDYYTAYCNI